MPTAQGNALLAKHAQAQAQVGRLTAQQMLRLWPLLVTGGRIDANAPIWLRATLALLQRQRAMSAGLSAQYMAAYRLAELGPAALLDAPTITPASALNVEQATTSLMVTGPQVYRAAVARQLGADKRELTPADIERTKLPPQQLLDIAAGNARAGVRHARNGGRDTVGEVIRADRRVIGAVRMIRSAHPCYFCSMLASRGPVYEGDSFDDSDPRFEGPGECKVHDGCMCELVPLYRKDSDPAITASIREHEERYIAAKRLAAQERIPVLLAFRRLHEGR